MNISIIKIKISKSSKKHVYPIHNPREPCLSYQPIFHTALNQDYRDKNPTTRQP